jgi:hypothetical protein
MGGLADRRRHHPKRADPNGSHLKEGYETRNILLYRSGSVKTIRILSKFT